VGRNDQTGTEFLALSTAAYHVYYEIMGTRLRYTDVSEMNEVLHRVAHALANVAPIYSRDRDAGTYRQLDSVDLIFGVFQRGGTVMRTSYAEYKGLAIRRSDMREAIEIFRRAGIKFARAAEAQVTKPTGVS
jgi:hypothetical protein